MCGIAGFAGEEEERMKRMIAALKHRGPDGDAILIVPGATLGHARLAILDPRPIGDQPMWNDSRTAVIVFNGEIFNYRRLIAEEKFVCKTGTDTEVILKLYDRYGIDCLPRLLGMFAFGIYDIRTHTWSVARDTSGIKPLYVSYPNGKLHFASEMRALIKALPIKPALNMTALSQYLRLQYVPGPQTLCEGIESLPPGTILEWSEKGERRRTFQTATESPIFRSKNHFREQLPQMMDDAVKDHLISDRPVGIFLSGGMDSSIVLHHMAQHAKGPIKTFTVRFEATEEEGAKRFNTDADLARRTAAHYGTDHHELLLTAELFREHYKECARSLDQPNADSVSVAQYLLSKEAKKSVDVILNGAGGDELFGGYPRYRIAHILEKTGMIPSGIRSLMGGMLGHPKDVLGMKPGPALAERLLARSIQETKSITQGRWFKPDAVTDLFEDRFSKLQQDDAVRTFMEFDRGLWLVDESLRLADATTMAFGVEGRVPFLDPRIIAAAHATPGSWHVSMKHTKVLLKQTYRPILPDHLFTLDKASFYPPLAKWIRRETAPLVEDMLASPHIQALFNTDAVRDVFEKHKAHTQYGLHTLSTLMQLSNWFETVYDAS
jgi:asparagine synthase (glutamine-hydrolysing)